MSRLWPFIVSGLPFRELNLRDSPLLTVIPVLLPSLPDKKLDSLYDVQNLKSE